MVLSGNFLYKKTALYKYTFFFARKSSACYFKWKNMNIPSNDRLITFPLGGFLKYKFLLKLANIYIRRYSPAYKNIYSSNCDSLFSKSRLCSKTSVTHLCCAAHPSELRWAFTFQHTQIVIQGQLKRTRDDTLIREQPTQETKVMNH